MLTSIIIVIDKSIAIDDGDSNFFVIYLLFVPFGPWNKLLEKKKKM